MTTSLDSFVVQRDHPTLIKLLIGAIGVNLTYKLLKARGGTRVRVPSDGRRAPLFVDIIGADAAHELARLFRGQDFLVLPKADKIVQQLRDRELIAARPSATIMQLALRYDLTSRQVCSILAQAGQAPPAEDEKQPDLFDGAFFSAGRS